MIHQFTVRNYKSLGDVTVRFDPVTVLIGRSGTGKTNLVQALQFLRNYVAARGNVQPVPPWPRILPATATAPVRLTFCLSFSPPGVRESYEYELVLQQGSGHGMGPMAAPQLTAERLSLGSRTLFHHNNRKWVVEPAVTGVSQPGTVMLGSLGGLPEVTRAWIFLTRGLGWYAFADHVLVFPAQEGSNDPLVREENGLSDHAANFLHAFKAITENLQEWQRVDEMVALLQKVNPSVTSIEATPPERNSISVGHSWSEKVWPFELAQESEGFRRFFAHLLALYQLPSKQALVFEEPEKGIHPGALDVLAAEILACPKAGRGQVIVTTHSPRLLDHFPPESLRVVEMANGMTKVGPVDQGQLESVREHLLEAGELLTVDLARIDSAATAGAAP